MPSPLRRRFLLGLFFTSPSKTPLAKFEVLSFFVYLPPF
ncbi:hypothetical protein COO91_09286 (plasmid) [Nostoc flagelliforme CCNUN1]|uniref:Uncharacterized protein n=1 Tax=Nostoc flagelliforme CCNUN1 TaxID=2038116 RepID=A0A2K8T5Y9_9NOSO|nr:hypothetical protein COO91_09286 [Nostoc flagelliforme CCNUN1]